MERAEFMKLVRAAGFVTRTIDLRDGAETYSIVQTAVPGSRLVEIERFYELAVATEREACAKVCEDLTLYTGFDCAVAIRTRATVAEHK